MWEREGICQQHMGRGDGGSKSGQRALTANCDLEAFVSDLVFLTLLRGPRIRSKRQILLGYLDHQPDENSKKSGSGRSRR